MGCRAILAPALPFLAAAAVLAASYGSGIALTLGGRLPIEDGLRRRLTIFAVGFGALALLVFALGLAHAFDRWVLRAIVAIGVVLAAPRVPGAVRTARSAWRSQDRVSRALLLLTGAILVVDIVLASAPPTSGDATGYHLTATSEWLDAGRIFPIWWDWPTFQPFTSEMHMALAQALDGGRAAMVTMAGLDVFATACVYGLARQLGGARVGAIAALLWVGQGIFLWEATGGFVEILLAGLVALAAWHLLALARTRTLSDAAWAGLAVGLGAGVKYHGLLFVPAAALAAAVVVRRGARRRGLVAAVVLGAALVALPWYVRNWIVAGNPVYPFASTLLGGRYVDAAARYDLDQSLNAYGLPGLWRLPLFPLEFLLHTGRYERGYAFSPALFVLPLVAVATGGRTVRIFAAAILVYVVVWWEGMQQITRYLLPVLPLAAVLAAVAAERLWRRGRGGRVALATVAAATVVPFVAITGLFAWRIAPGALGIESQAHFVQRLTGTYDAFRWLDTRLPRDGRVLIGVRDRYWLRRPSAAYDIPIFSYEQTPEKTIARMRAYDVRYVAFIDAGLPNPLHGLKLRRLATLDVPLVTSRTLGRIQDRRLVVWAWCGARPSPCGAVP